MNKQVGIKQATKKGYIECDIGGVVNFAYPTSELRRGRVIDNGQVCPTITTQESMICRIEERNCENMDNNEEFEYRIRRITPKEAWRLMSFDEDDYEKAATCSSETQLYKQAGNSIICTVLCALFSQLNIKNCTPWNERTTEEREQLYGKRYNNSTNS